MSTVKFYFLVISQPVADQLFLIGDLGIRLFHDIDEDWIAPNSCWKAKTGSDKLYNGPGLLAKPWSVLYAWITYAWILPVGIQPHSPWPVREVWKIDFRVPKKSPYYLRQSILVIKSLYSTFTHGPLLAIPVGDHRESHLVTDTAHSPCHQELSDPDATSFCRESYKVKRQIIFPSQASTPNMPRWGK